MSDVEEPKEQRETLDRLIKQEGDKGWRPDEGEAADFNRPNVAIERWNVFYEDLLNEASLSPKDIAELIVTLETVCRFLRRNNDISRHLSGEN